MPAETVLTSNETYLSFGPLKLRYSTLLGELDFSIFLVGTISGDPGASPVIIDSAGLFLASNPVAGGASWTGQVAGIDSSEGETRGNMVLGDAEVVLTDFSDPRADIFFSGLQDLDTGSERDDMSWLGLHVSDGAFFSQGDSGMLSGRFYGPQQEEVGGTFDRNQVRGAFGASRSAGTGGQQTGSIPDVPSEETDLELPSILGDITVRFELSSLHLPGGQGDARIRFSHQADENEFGFNGSIDQLATWLPESMSYFERSSFGGLDLLLLTDSLGWTVFSFRGPTTSTNPQAGGARWRGTFVGLDNANPDANYRGDVLLVIPDFVNPAVDVWFRNTFDLNSNTSIPDVLWLAVPVTRGTFQAPGGDGWIAGRFHGSSHEDVSGRVRQGTVAGVFSAQREPEGSQQAEMDSDVEKALQILGYAAGLEELPDLTRSRASAAEGSGEVFPPVSDGPPGLLATLFSGYSGEAVEVFNFGLADLEELAANSPSIDLEVEGGDLPGGRFGVLRWTLPGSDGELLESTLGFAYGAAMTVNPVGGSARWTGEVVGIDITHGGTSGNKIHGIADLVVQNFSMPEIDVAFTGIRDLDLDAPLADITWDAIPLRQGAFRFAQPGSVIDGRMYGADHAHIGGVFERDGIVGAFGAERSPSP